MIGPAIDFSKPFWRPTGTAEAVFYLGEKLLGEEMVASDAGRTLVRVLLSRSRQDQAMRYLRPCAQSWYVDHPGQHGLTCCPDLRSEQAYLPAELREQAGRLGVQVQHQIASDSWLAQDPMAIKRGERIRWERAEEGVWCVFCAD